MPTISAVIPAYNSAAFLPEAVASIRRQTHPVDEIIVVDDGSTDDTARVAEALGGDLRVVRQDNAGPSVARNHGVELAGGEWIAFLDADDQWTGVKIARQLAAVGRQPELTLVASDMREVGHGGSVLVPSVLAGHGLLERFQALAGRPVPNALSALMEKNFIPTGTVLARRAVLIEAGLFNPEVRYGEDLELWAKVAARHPITCLPEVHMLRRKHAENATRATTAILEDLVRVTKNVRAYAGDHLRAEGTDPDRLVSAAWAALGYRYFDTGEPRLARGAFWASLGEQLSVRALAYGLACLMPLSLIHRARHLKQALSHITGSR